MDGFDQCVSGFGVEVGDGDEIQVAGCGSGGEEEDGNYAAGDEEGVMGLCLLPEVMGDGR